MKLPSQKTIDAWNERAKINRSIVYAQRSDGLFIAYQKYLALGETEKAEQARIDWLNMIKEIDEAYPYYDLESTDTTETETKTTSVETVEVETPVE